MILQTEKRKLKRGFRSKITDFKGNYINHIPVINLFELD